MENKTAQTIRKSNLKGIAITLL